MRTTHVQKGMPELPTPYNTVAPPHVKCFTEYLRAAGYFCTNNEKTDYQFQTPRTAWDEQGHQAHWRNRPAPDQPFFSVFNLGVTHESGMWEDKNPKAYVDPDTIPLPPYFPDTPKVRESMARMYNNISYNDSLLGQMLQDLEDDGLAENTIVFHWSDHGPLPRGKRWPYDSGIHIPMIIRWPDGLTAGEVRDELISSIDLGPTVLSLAGLDIPHHIQGQAFLGPERAPSRDYVFASRDRHDCTYDRVRACRDQRFKYIRNYYPEAPRAVWIPYLHQHPIMEELWRLHLSGELTDLQESLFFANTRAVEELYDTEADPFETNNLAKDLAYDSDRRRLSDALDNWLDEVGDMGEISESEMVARWYPNGKQPQTVAPIAACYQEGCAGLGVMDEETCTSFPATIILQSATQGASIAYQLEGDSHWRLYTGPLRLQPKQHSIKTIANRIGYAESEERLYRVNVKQPSTTISA